MFCSLSNRCCAAHLTRHQCLECHSHAGSLPAFSSDCCSMKNRWKATFRQAVGNAGHRTCGRTLTPLGQSASQRPTLTQPLKGGGRGTGLRPRAHPSTQTKLQQTLRSSPLAAAHASVLVTSLLCWKLLLHWQCYSGNADAM